MSKEELLRAAESAVANGRTAEADQLSRSALDLDPTFVPALLLAGSIAAKRGNSDEAVALLRRALRQEPDSDRAILWLAALLRGVNGGEESVQLGKEAVRIGPHDPEAHTVLGLTHLARSETLEAIGSFRRAIRLSPGLAAAHHNLGVALQRDEQYEEASQAFRRAIELAPTALASHVHLGQVYLSRGMFEETMECARRSLEIKSDSLAARKMLTDAILRSVEGPDAEKHITRAMQGDPAAGFPHALLAARQQEQGRFEEAEKSIRRSVELEPNQGFPYYLWVNNRKMTEADLDLINRIEDVAEKGNVDPLELRYLHLALGKAYDDLGKYERAIHEFDIANGHSQGVIADQSSFDTAKYMERNRVYRAIFTKDFLGESRRFSHDIEKPIFIVGMPRSGTTLLEQVLSRHSSVGAGGEQTFWRDRINRLIDFESQTLDLVKMEKEGRRYLDLLNSLGHGKQHVTDKFPSNYIYLGPLALIFPNARFIHARRHPVDTCLSIYTRPLFTINEFGQSRRNIVDAYLVYRDLMAHWRETLPPERLLDVDYELLVSDPEPEIRRLIEFCGLKWEEACLSPEEADRRVNTFSLWQVRQPIYRSSVDRWRNYEPWLGVFREVADTGQV